MTPEEVKAYVGSHHYFRVGAFDAAERVQERCPKGWKSWVAFGVMTPPEGAIRVGQVRVHHGDPAYPLYVYPAA